MNLHSQKCKFTFEIPREFTTEDFKMFSVTEYDLEKKNIPKYVAAVASCLKPKLRQEQLDSALTNLAEKDPEIAYGVYKHYLEVQKTYLENLKRFHSMIKSQ